MEGSSAIRLVAHLPYEVIYSILRRLSAEDIEELQYVNRRMHAIVSSLDHDQRQIWFPFRMIPRLYYINHVVDEDITADLQRGEEYNHQQAITRRAIAYQSERVTVRKLALEAFKRGIFSVVHYHLTNDSQYFPEPEGIDNNTFSFMKEFVNAASETDWYDLDDDELFAIYARASSGAYEVFEWCKNTQLNYRRYVLDACVYLSQNPVPDVLYEDPTMTRDDYRAYRYTLFINMLTQDATRMTPRKILTMTARVHPSNTDILETLNILLNPTILGPRIGIDQQTSIRQITLDAFRQGDLKVSRQYIMRYPYYFPTHRSVSLDTLQSNDIFKWIVHIVNTSPNDWITVDGGECDNMLFHAGRGCMYELFEWVVRTQPHIEVDSLMMERLGSDPGEHDIPTEDAIIYRRSLFSYILRTSKEKFSIWELLLLVQMVLFRDVEILKMIFLVIVDKQRVRAFHYSATIPELFGVSPIIAQLYTIIPKFHRAGFSILRWLYYHYNYTIPGNRSSSSNFIRGVIASGLTLDTILMLIRLDRTLLTPMAEVMSSIVYGEFVPMEFGIICILNGIDIEHIARRMVNGSSRQASDTYILHVLMTLKCYENLSYSAHYMDMIHDIRKDGYHQLLATLQGGYGPATDAGSLCRAGAILDNVTWVSDALPRVLELGQEVCNLALQMASVNVLYYLQKNYDLVPDDDAILWTCRYGMADALRSVGDRVTQIYHLAAAIEMGNVETALYLRDELHVPMPPSPNITTLSMKRALGVMPDMMQLCREGNLALLQTLTPDPFYFLPAVEVGNGRVLEWFIDNAENLPITEACQTAIRNEMWYLYDWLAKKNPDMQMLSRLHQQWGLFFA